MYNTYNTIHNTDLPYDDPSLPSKNKKIMNMIMTTHMVYFYYHLCCLCEVMGDRDTH